MKRLFFPMIASALLTSGCWIASPPTTPYGNEELDPQKLPVLTESAPVGLHSPRLLVLGRFDSVATQPVGGLYDHDDYSISPLYRTYLFRDGALELFEASCDALRATGLDVRKDYQTEGEPSLVEQRLKLRNPLLISGYVAKLQTDQIRTDDKQPQDYEVAKLEVTIVVRDLTGAERFRKAIVIEGRIPARPDSNLLRTLGIRLGETLTHDPAFVHAVEAA